MRYFVTLFALFCGVFLVLSFQLGNQWITVGYGIHPILAGGFVVVLFFAPIAMTALIGEIEE